MRRAGRVDADQTAIVDALRKVGCSVTVTSDLGGGFPDLVVGYHSFNYLIEVKDGNKSPSRQKLTRAEREWHDNWRGAVAIVRSVDEALKLVAVRG